MLAKIRRGLMGLVAGALVAAVAALPAQQALEAARVEPSAPLVAGPYLRLWPHRHQTDGFFAAVWQKS